MKAWIRKTIKHLFNLYDLDDLVIGAHCGCCGKWVSNHIVPDDGWRVTICDTCGGFPITDKEIDK